MLSRRQLHIPVHLLGRLVQLTQRERKPYEFPIRVFMLCGGFSQWCCIIGKYDNRAYHLAQPEGRVHKSRGVFHVY